MSGFVYRASEPDVFTTGYYDPHGNWVGDMDCRSRREAAERVNYLNGGSPELLNTIERVLDALWSIVGAINQR